MKILVPVDGSRHANDGLRVASKLGKGNGTRLYVMTVIPSVADIDLELSASERDRVLESMKQRGEEVIARSLEVLRSQGMEAADPVLAVSASPAQEIVSFAEKEKVDLIVIGSRGRNGNSRFPFGSVAAQVVQHSPCCVYVVKEPCWP